MRRNSRRLLDQVAARPRRHRRCRARTALCHARAPFEDLGFARVDHHRALRQGFPEVVLGLGKTPAQIGSIAAEMLSARLDAAGDPREQAAYDAVRVKVLGAAVITCRCRLIKFRQQDVAQARTHHGRAAGTSDFPSPRKRLHGRGDGQRCCRLYDVGVAGLHRSRTKSLR